MRADPRFAEQPIHFWAYVRAISEATGYSKRGSNEVSSFSVREMIAALDKLDRSGDVLGTEADPTPLAQKLCDYFQYRAEILNGPVLGNLMVTAEAMALFEQVKTEVGATDRTEIVKRSKGVDRPIAVEYTVAGSTVRVPMNKQSGEMRYESYLTGMVNLLLAHALDGRPCDYDPRKIPVIDHNGALYAAFSRRMDGSYPSTVNPIAMWEIKEYYYTTTFGSKISDAVYITSLDGYERREVEQETGQSIEFIVIVDARDTWWGKGKSYLCRMIDVLNMGHVQEIIFGREVRERLPVLAAQWIRDDTAPEWHVSPVEAIAATDENGPGALF